MYNLNWWNTIFYKIDVKNFFDYNNDGYGDILGIVNKLSYFKELSVGVLLLRNFLATDDEKNPLSFSVLDKNIGSMEDLSLLLEKAKEEEIKIVLEFPINYSSIDAFWFENSQSSKKSEKADWYIWEDIKDNKPPNLDKNIFGETAWVYSKNRNQYYLSRFKKKGADLNWNFYKVRKKMGSILRYWQSFGIDGFVFLDIEYFYYNLENNKDNKEQKNIEFIKYFSDIANEKQSFFTMGIFHNKENNVENILKRSLKYVSKLDKLISINIENFFDNLNFDLLVSLLDKISSIFLDTLISFTLSNKETFLQKYGEKRFLYAFLIFTFRCIPLIKYGDELDYKEDDKIFKWSSWDRNFGFNSGLSLPYKEIDKDENSLDLCRKDKNSFFNFLKQIIKIRKDFSALSFGSYQKYLVEKEVFAYLRQDDNYKILAVLNFSKEERKIKITQSLQTINIANEKMAVLQGDILTLPIYGFYLAEVLD